MTWVAPGTPRQRPIQFGQASHGLEPARDRLRLDAERAVQVHEKGSDPGWQRGHPAAGGTAA
ncbi:MAG: hypothetical protein ACRDPM_00885 [Solirubrobacteraceae bacterium]